MSFDPTAMMGGGVCWLDYDRDGWLDLFVVNSYAQADASRVGDEGRPSAQRALPERAGPVRGRELALRRRPAAPWKRVRGGRLRPRRPHRPLRHDGRTTSRPTVRRAALERGRRLLHRGRRCGGIKALGWHAGAAVGDVNGDGRPDLFVAVHRPQLADPQVRQPASRPTTTPYATSSTSTRVRTRTGHPTFREVGRAAGIDEAARPRARRRSSPTSTATVVSTCTWRTTPIRTSCTGTSPASGRRPVSASASRTSRQRGRRRPQCRHGDRRRGLQRRRQRRPLGHELAGAAARGLPQPIIGRRPSFTDVPPAFRRGVRNEVDGLGRVVGRPRPRRRPRSRRGERGHPGREPREERAARPGARERSSAGRRVRFAQVELGARVRASTAGASLRPTTTTTATSTSRSTPSAAGCSSSRTAVPRALARGAARGVRARDRRHRDAPDGRTLVREVLAGSSYLSSEDPRVHFGLGRRRRG